MHPLDSLLLQAAADEPGTHLVLADHLEEQGAGGDAEALRAWWLGPPALAQVLRTFWDGGFIDRVDYSFVHGASGDHGGAGTYGDYGGDGQYGGHGGLDYVRGHGGQGGRAGAAWFGPGPVHLFYPEAFLHVHHAEAWAP